jgi:hypothetical protein
VTPLHDFVEGLGVALLLTVHDRSLQAFEQVGFGNL